MNRTPWAIVIACCLVAMLLVISQIAELNHRSVAAPAEHRLTATERQLTTGTSELDRVGK